MADDLVTVKTCLTLSEAESARLGLELEGIDATIADANIVTADWFLANAVGYIKVNVLASQAERAVEILERNQRRFDESRANATEDDAVCLGCGAELPDDSDTCLACGWSYGQTAGEADGDETGESTDNSTAD